MTSLLVRPTSPDAASTRPRPLVLVATLGGLVAALGPLVVLLAVGVVGWFVSDAGAHGEPSDGMRVGALAWLAAHGSGFSVMGARVDLVPLGLTALSAWSVWRVAHRVGDEVSGHGPDAHRLSDGERDLTVPTSVVLFFAGYAVVAVVVAALASGSDTTPSVPRVLAWSLGMTLALAAPAIAIGSGRAAIWTAMLPRGVRAAAVVTMSVLTALAVVSAGIFLVALGAGSGDAATMFSRLHTSPSEAGLYALVNAAYLPNASVFAGSWLLGPGFAIGGGTMVSPTVVVLGPLPLVPILAALPAAGTPAGWVSSLVFLPPLLAAFAAFRALRRRGTALRWDEAALAGCGGGILAGALFALLASVAGGAVGPGRMRHVGPFVPEVLVHAVAACGIGGLVGALVWVWWQRRGALDSEE
ncbi:hypothetical protein EXE58_12525 [Nocardioides seonyuensis]|uniref:Uncharacterized protein n=1 Tax=Nocardioides seonyuensis TaxID=2518371 RepID=A0A4P7IHN2_9ACTN|nr:DUF6350 family protein [Nocardioides seonyuensis]QBX56213.1 hypothetical protein EXE58_12525 [Nocardioides seonyuensis]